MKIFVVIPGFNEQAYLERLLKKLSKFSSNVIFVDDGSSDNSAQVAAKFTPHVLVHQVNLGKGAAMLTGGEYAFKELGADAVVFMDADDQHDPVHLPDFAKKMKKYDIVFGVRDLGVNMPLARYMGNKFASVLLKILFGRYIADIPSGYKGMTKDAFNKLKWKSSGYEVETEIAVRVVQQNIPFGTVEIRAIYHDRDKGLTLFDAAHITHSIINWRLGL
jgi:glycosyltransferase involved in cell wall biosynthesis